MAGAKRKHSCEWRARDFPADFGNVTPGQFAPPMQNCRISFPRKILGEAVQPSLTVRPRRIKCQVDFHQVEKADFDRSLIAEDGVLSDAITGGKIFPGG